MSSELKPHCETCGKPVAETLCPICAKWWADNVPGDEGGKSLTIDEGLAWRNPAPDAAQPAINSGIHRTITLKAGQRITFVSDHGGGSGGGGSSSSPDLSAQPTYDRASMIEGARMMREMAAKDAKTGWISADYDVVGIADADQAMKLCQHIEDSILALDPASVVGEG